MGAAAPRSGRCLRADDDLGQAQPGALVHPAGEGPARTAHYARLEHDNVLSDLLHAGPDTERQPQESRRVATQGASGLLGGFPVAPPLRGDAGRDAGPLAFKSSSTDGPALNTPKGSNETPNREARPSSASSNGSRWSDLRCQHWRGPWCRTTKPPSTSGTREILSTAA